MPRPHPRSVLASEKGSIDVSSVVVAALLGAVLFLGVVAVLFGLIPFVQDNGARQDLAAIRTAEATAVARDGHYYDHEGLAAQDLVSDIGATVVGTDAARTCYVAMTKSGSGKFFYSTNASGDARPLEGGTVTGCIDFDAQIALSEKIGAPSPSYGDLENGSFEDDFAGWRAGPAGGTAPVISTTAADVADGKKAANLLPMTYVEQDVQVPSGGAAILSLSAKITTTGTLPASAPLKLELLNRTGAVLGTPEPSAPASRSYTPLSYDLSEFAGQNVTIRLGVAATANVRWTSVDKISLQPSVTTAPTVIRGYGTDGGAHINWKAPAQGGASVTSYILVTYKDFKVVGTTTVTSTSAHVTGLSNGSSYSFAVKAVNAIGESPLSPTSPDIAVRDTAVANGSFEGGPDGWTVTGGASVDFQNNTGDGTWVANMANDSTVSQRITVPAGTTAALSFKSYLQVGYKELTGVFKVDVLDESGAVLATNNFTTRYYWTDHTMDLSAHTGRTVTIKFTALTAGYQTLLDSVAVTAR